MNKPHNIVLTGFMGSGKTTVAHSLAEKLRWAIVDTDALIESRTHLVIPKLFQLYGESFFRTIEKGVCFEVSLRSQTVISTGGGALMNQETRQTMMNHGFVVCLTARPETIEKRILQNAQRPLASQWRELYEQRYPVYMSFEHRIHTDEHPPAYIAQEIIELWNASQ